MSWLGGRLAMQNCRALGCGLYIKTGVVNAICILVSEQSGPTVLLCDQQCTVLN